MADILPPLEQIPASASPELLQQLQHSAEWASTFGGSDTNLAQRWRHNQDIAAYASELQDQREQAQSDLIHTNKAAQNFYFKQQQLDMQEQIADQNMKQAAELHPLKLQALKDKSDAEAARAATNFRVDSFKTKAAAQEAADTAAFHDDIDKAFSEGIRIGTPEYADRVARARLRSPAMKSEYFDDVWKSTAASKLTPDEAIADAVAKERALAEVRAEVRAEVKSPIAELASLEKERAMHSKMLDRAKRIRARATDENIIKDADADILESQQSLDDIESQIRTHRAGSTSTPKPSATSPSVAPASQLKPLEASVAAAARAAISSGKDAEAVKKRLQESGYDASSL